MSLRRIHAGKKNERILMDNDERMTSEELQQAHPELHLLSQEDCAFLDIKLSKRKIGYKDYEQMKQRLAGHSLMVVRPGDVLPHAKTVEGYLVEENRLMVFSSLDNCGDYLQYLGTENGLSDCGIPVAILKVEEVTALAEKYNLLAVLDGREEPGKGMLVYDGGNKRWFAALPVRYPEG
jgi:hypothetical protein